MSANFDFRIVKQDRQFSFRMVEYDSEGEIDWVDESMGPGSASRITGLKRILGELSLAFSQPTIDWDSVPLDRRGIWLTIRGKRIKFHEMKPEDLPADGWIYPTPECDPIE